MTNESLVNRILNVGLVIDDLDVSYWEYELVKKMISEQVAEVTTVMVLSQGISAHPDNDAGRKIRDFHMRLDEKHFKPRPNAFAKKNLQDLIPDAKQWLTNVTVDHMSKEQFDFIIWLSPQSPQSYWYDHTNNGILSFAHGEENCSLAILGYEEFMKMEGVISSALILKKKEEDLGKIIYQTWSTMPSLSMSRSRNEHVCKLLSFVPRALNVFAKKGNDAFIGNPNYLAKEHSSNSRPLSKIKAITNLSNHFCRMVYNTLRKKLYREQWLLLFQSDQTPPTSFDQFKKIYPPKESFWADPILVQREQKNYLFFEELPYANNRGFISVVEMDENGFSSPITPIIQQPYHLSYPFIFEKEGTYYMVPESKENRNVQLYECKHFPLKWEHKMDLMQDVRAVDTTLFHHDGKWWMFTVMVENEGAGTNDELFLFYADTPFTQDWTSHPNNPIISDVRSARPGGSIYVQDGKIIRPSQDCSKKYGYGFNLNEIEVLTETDYQEKRILHITPWDKSIKRTHSFAHQKGISVIDGLIQRRRF